MGDTDRVVVFLGIVGLDGSKLGGANMVGMPAFAAGFTRMGERVLALVTTFFFGTAVDNGAPLTTF